MNRFYFCKREKRIKKGHSAGICCTSERWWGTESVLEKPRIVRGDVKGRDMQQRCRGLTLHQRRKPHSW
jgi:hypothetical protein